MTPPITDATGAPTQHTRRSYLGWLLGLCSAGVSAILAVPLIRFALYPLTAKTTETKWSDIGPSADFQEITTPIQRLINVEQVDGWRKQISDKVVYVTKTTGGETCVLSSVCPHLGCSVQWAVAQHQFVCPCHGATFGIDGARLGGPAPRAMDRLDSKVEADRLIVRYRYFRQLVPGKEVIG